MYAIAISEVRMWVGKPALLVIGLLSIAGGAFLYLLPLRSRSDFDRKHGFGVWHPYKNPGYSAVVGGACLFLIGITLVIFAFS